MIAKIIKVESGKVIPNESCLIPSVKRFLESCKRDNLDWESVLLYWYFILDPESPYSNMEEQVKLEKARECVDLEPFQLMEEYHAALGDLESLYETPIRRYYDSLRAVLDKISIYNMVTEVTDGRDGSHGNLRSALTDSQKMIDGYKRAESAFKEELIGRGGLMTGYDIL